MDSRYIRGFSDNGRVYLQSRIRQAKLSLSEMAKIAMIVVLAVVLAVSSAASFGGVKDLAGNYYDFTTGQYSSSLTGKVYNTAPVVAPVAYASPYASPYAYAPSYAASYAAPVVAAASPYNYYAPYAPYAYGGASYVSPLWKK